MVGFLNTFSNDFIVLNKGGTSFIPLGTQEKRAIFNPDGTERMVHSLRSCEYLRIEPSNLMQFDRPNQDQQNRTICVQEQQFDPQGNTYYADIFKLNIDEMSVRELMLVQSVFQCDNAMEIVELIDLQPSPAIFFKSFMELDQANLVQIMAFDSKIIRKLLENTEYEFSKEFPIFYKIRMIDSDG